jgi:PAS domain S-box-containing protein
LRRRAEALLPECPTAQFGPAASPEDVSTLLRELRLHEIELELQNAALRETQLELDKARTRFSELYEHAPIPYLSLTKDSTIVLANDAALKLVHAARDRVVGARFSTYVTETDASAFALHQRAAASSHGAVSCQLALDVAGAPKDVQLHSIRARDQSRELLMMITAANGTIGSARPPEAQPFPSAILDAVGPVAVLDLQGRIIQLSHACSALLGAATVATGRHFWDVFATSPEQRAKTRQGLRAALADAKPQEWEVTFVAPDGAPRHIVWSFVPLVEPGSALRYLTAIGNDVTGLKALQARLVACERLAPIGQLAAGVGHEINNPLTYVRSSLELATVLLNGVPPKQDKLKHLLDVAIEGVDRIGLIVDDLRLWSSNSGPPVEAVDVRRLLDSCVQLATNEIRHCARLVVDYQEVPKILANAGRLSQVFLNLLVNAAQSIAPGHASDNEIKLTVREDAKGGVLVEVRDTGGGIRPQDLPHVFEPFFTTKTCGVGTGLGLAICHGLITELGGQITVESVIDRGTTFRLWIPGRAAVHVAPETPAAALPPTASKLVGRHILVIDDEPRIIESFVLLLGEKHHVQTTSNGRDALELCRRQEFDIIFCDLRMPEMGGTEVYRTLHAKDAAQAERIVFMTGSLAGAPDLQTFVHGDVTVLRKPFSAKDLAALLATRFA